MKTLKLIFVTLLLLLPLEGLHAQGHLLRGEVLSAAGKPIEGAIISAEGSESVRTGADGKFDIALKEETRLISVWAAGYYPVTRWVDRERELQVRMRPEYTYKYNETMVLPMRVEHSQQRHTSASNLHQKDFQPGSMKIDRALAGQVAGLRTVRASGMPGEGSYLNLRGVRSFVGANAPLIVINGIPYLPDTHESPLLGGFSRDIFQAYNIGDIQNITVLKGGEAAIYGSMGGNGVILIETKGATSDNLETRVSFSGLYGVNWNNKRMPLLEGNDYKSYLSDVGMTYFDNMENFFAEFPFLSNPNSKYYYLYNNQTDWQDEIYKRSFVTDNLFRVEGGDAIAKYNLSLGYALENGLMQNVKNQRYHTQLNTNVLISKRVELTATVGLAYLTGNYQPQGMDAATNPVLAAYLRAPLLSPYKKDNDGNLLASYSSYYYGQSERMDFAVSNPLALIQTLDGRNRQYDVNFRLNLTYRPFKGMTVDGTFGMFYNYNKEHLFVPGVSTNSILPLVDRYGTARNSVKEGVGEALNMFAGGTARYQTVFQGVHKLNAFAGAQLLMTRNKYEGGAIRNTPNDFYQTLGDSKDVGRYFYGYLEKWNWGSFYAHADYTYRDMLTASAHMSLDGASSVGTYGNHFQFYPAVGLTWMGAGWLPLSDSSWINRLNLRAEYGLSGNSRFSSNLGKYYYTSLPYMTTSGIVRANISNTRLKPEKNASLNLGMDVSLLRNRLEFTLDYYDSRSKDVIFAQPHTSAYGTLPHYINCGKIGNKGVELSAQATLVRTSGFEWMIGGNIARNEAEVESLGATSRLIHMYEGGVQLVSAEGHAPYQFYGYRTRGVFSTQAEADAAHLKNRKGQFYRAGDVHYIDQNGDGRIDQADRVSLGSAAPKFFGGFFTQLKYHSWMLVAEFAYAKGGKAYNAVRRQLESLSSFGNQSVAVMNRWSLEGQQTTMPRAEWKDPMGNNDFSDRWIEDASFLRMKNVTLSYSFDRKVLNFFRSGMLYVTGENLWTGTKYLGMDPEFSYSYRDDMQGFDYAKLMQPKSIKIGVNLNF